MNTNILLVSGAPGAAHCAKEMARTLDSAVDLVGTRHAALKAVQRRSYELLVLEDSLAEGDAAQTATLLEAADGAYPLQLNFAVTGADRAVREVRAALHRRSREVEQARTAAVRAIEAEISSDLTGMLLELDLIAGSRRIPPEEATHLGRAISLTRNLRRKLSSATRGPAALPLVRTRHRAEVRETVGV